MPTSSHSEGLGIELNQLWEHIKRFHAQYGRHPHMRFPSGSVLSSVLEASAHTCHTLVNSFSTSDEAYFTEQGSWTSFALTSTSPHVVLGVQVCRDKGSPLVFPSLILSRGIVVSKHASFSDLRTTDERVGTGLGKPPRLREQ